MSIEREQGKKTEGNHFLYSRIYSTWISVIVNGTVFVNNSKIKNNKLQIVQKCIIKNVQYFRFVKRIETDSVQLSFLLSNPLLFSFRELLGILSTDSDNRFTSYLYVFVSLNSKEDTFYFKVEGGNTINYNDSVYCVLLFEVSTISINYYQEL